MSTKTIAIVGAGPGLGRSLAKRFGQEGYAVALIARNPDKLDAPVAELTTDGITAERFLADVTDETALTAALAAAEQRFGQIDVLEYSPVVIPASFEDFAPLEVTATTTALARQSIELIGLGAVTSVQAVLPAMLERKAGTIIITTGVSAIGFMPMVGAWGFAGAAARNYARTLNFALRDSGVFVGSICRGVQVRPGDEFGDPDLLAETYFRFAQERDTPELLINHTDPGLVQFD